MKKNLLPTFLLLIICLFINNLNVFSQNKSLKSNTNSPIDYYSHKVKLITLNIDNINKDSILFPKSLTKGNFYRIKVNGINQNVYKINIDKTDTNFLNDFLNFGILTTIFPSSVNFQSFSDKILELSKDEITNNNKGRFPASVEKLSIGFYKSEIPSIQKQIRESSKRGNELVKSINDLIFSIYNPDLDLTHKHQNEIIFGSIMLRIDSHLNKINVLKNDFDAFYHEYQLNRLDDLELYFNDKVFISLDTIIANNISSIQQDIDTIMKQFSNEKVNWIYTKIGHSKKANSTYYSPVLQFMGDVDTIFVHYNLRDTNLTKSLSSYTTKFFIEANSPFYVGLGASIYYNHLRNNQYSLDSFDVNDSTINYIVRDEEVQKGEIGITALVHFGWRLSANKSKIWNSVSINAVLGPAISLSDPIRPRFAVGGGLSFGKTNLFTINWLHMGGMTETISKSAKVNENLSYKPANYTITKMSRAGGISIGYIYKISK